MVIKIKEIPLAQLKSNLTPKVDTLVSEVYTKFTRFSLEYAEREAAALAFANGGYVGDAGPWVMAFANNAGKTAQQAADIIIAQANQLREALVALAAQRMRKYSIVAAADAVAAQAMFDDITSEVEAIAAGLS